MYKIGLLSGNKNKISNLAVDGLIYGLVSGVAMTLSLAVFALLSGETLGTYLKLFSAGKLSSPLQGLLSHLAVSAIYGVFFGALIWPTLACFSSKKIVAILGGLAYGLFLLFLAQIAILPVTSSPLGQIPAWQWALAHGVYGLALGGLFAWKTT
jgi:hypothetical protein